MKLTFCMLVFMGFSFALGSGVLANTIMVDDAADTSGGTTCTLRDALAAANSDSAQGGCAAGSGADTIQFSLPQPARITLSSNSELGVSSDVTITGPGAASLVIDGNRRHGGTRIFHITAGTAVISNLTLKNGNAGAAYGGAVLVDLGATLELQSCTVEHNIARSGGGVANRGTATLSGCSVRGNEASLGFDLFDGSGGGIFSFGANAIVTISNSSISHNVSFGHSAGGISVTADAPPVNAALTLINSTVNANASLNKYGYGIGGVDTDVATSMINSTIQGNHGGTAGGVLVGVSVIILNCTISGNRAKGGTGGINGGGSGSLSLGNTIVARSGRNGGDCLTNVHPVNDLGHNLIDDPFSNCHLTNGVNGNIIGSAAGLLHLASNGGATKTMGLCTGPGMPRASCQAASPAVNNGDTSICQGSSVNNLDQRGHLRINGSDTTCDIGAYESP